MSLPEHKNNCFFCGTRITTYGNTVNKMPEPAYCDSCDGYPCYCEYHGAFVVAENPRYKNVRCPECGSLDASVQVENGWY